MVAKMAKMAKAAKNSGSGAMAIFAGRQPGRGRAKNLGSIARLFRSTEILCMRAQDDTFWGPFGRFRMPLLDDDRSLHVRVELAEIFVRPRRVEFLRERFARGDCA
jgi:hypothetical protein